MLSTSRSTDFYLNTVDSIPSDVKITKSKTYSFINFIRFISMMGIVWGHINLIPPNESFSIFLSKTDYPNICLAFFQIFKFAVICFFLISGFLLGDKLNTTTDPIRYFKKRVTSTIKPYLVVYVIYIIVPFIVPIIRFYALHQPIRNINSLNDILLVPIFFTWLWYLPNYLICLAILLLFHKVIYKKALGIGFLIITLVYSILTVYTHQFQMPHSTALFAFVFYLWLGSYLKHINFIEKLKKVNTSLLFCIVVIMFSLSWIESSYLFKHQLSFFSVLRIFNQLYSISIFIFLIKICSKKPKFGIFNPRKETYGIYLYHGIVLTFFLPVAIKFLNIKFNIDIYTNNTCKYMFNFVLTYIVVYLLSVFVVKLLLRFNLGYLNIKPLKEISTSKNFSNMDD